VRTCPQCGAQVGPTDDFCGNCGNYLGWGGQPVPESDTGATTAVAPRRTADAVAPRLTDEPPTAVAPRPANEPPVETDPAKLGPVLPGRPEARRPLPTATAADGVEGPPCPVCGTPNPPGRRFCRRCATPLQPREQTPAATRRRKWRWRGDRSRWLRRLVWALVVVAVVVAGVVFWPRATGLWEDLRDRLGSAAPVRPASTAASAAVPEHPAGAAVDGFSNRYWGAPAVGDSIEFTFASPFRLLSVVVNSGAAPEEQGFNGQARPTELDMVVTSSDGATQTVPITLADEPGPQRTDTGISDVVRIKLVVRAAAGVAPGRQIALGEVEFFRRS
jgi:predicted nucleic acid-binding Zn ribbon protein